MALTINFTGENKVSTDQIGYFPTIANMTRGAKAFLSYLLRDILTLASAITTDNTRRFTEDESPQENIIYYYPKFSERPDEQQVTWNFSNTSDIISISDDFWIGGVDNPMYSHRFYDDTVNLGGGNDRLSLGIDFYNSGVKPYNDELYLSYRDEFLDRGSTLAINGGTGNDYINVQGYSEDFIINKIGDEIGYAKAAVVRINGDAGSDKIYVGHHAGIIHGDTPLKSGTTGADRIESDVFSDYIDGGAGPDIIRASRVNWLSSLSDFSEIEKDFLRGGHWERYVQA